MADQSLQAIADLQKRFKQMSVHLPVIAGNVVVNFALENFKRQGFLGNSFQPWRKRKSPTKWGKKVKNNGRALLILTGRLRRSIRATKATWSEVVVGTNVPYAKVHNEGLRVGQIQKVGSFNRKQTYAGVASKFKASGQEIETGEVYSLKTHGRLKNKKITANTTVKAHTRRINQNIPARPFLADSPYLRKELNRVIGAQILKAFKQ